jgi:hypothetical protein
MNTERFTADERGVSEVVGAILVFALVVAMVGIIQSQAIPNQNQEIEAQHSLEVQSDLTKFHQLASSVAADGSDRSKSFNMGTGYPARLIFFNPPRVQGQLETTDRIRPPPPRPAPPASPSQVTLKDFSASNQEVDDYITGSQSGRLDLQTRRLQYTVDYNEYQNDPTTRYEYGVLYNEYDTGTIIENEGNIIDGTRINLLFMAGDYAESSTTEESLSVQGVSAPARSVTITGTGSNCNNPLKIELPTELKRNKWQDLYSGGNVCSIEDVSGQPKIRINLDPTQTYDLRMSRIGLEPGAASQTAHYIVPVDPGVASAGVGQPATIEYEVRDEFNNPVAGETVQLLDENGNVVTSEPSNDNGRVSFTVNTASTGDFEANLEGGTCSGTRSARCLATYKVQVPGLNLNPNSGVRLVEATTDDPLPNQRTDTPETEDAANCEPTSCEAEVTFENTNSKEVGMESIRINHYNPDPQGHSPVIIEDGSNTVDAKIGGAAKDASQLNSIAKDGGTETYTFIFNGEVHEGDYFVVTIIFDNNERALYFVSPKANPT